MKRALIVAMLLCLSSAQAFTVYIKYPRLSPTTLRFYIEILYQSGQVERVEQMVSVIRGNQTMPRSSLTDAYDVLTARRIEYNYPIVLQSPRVQKVVYYIKQNQGGLVDCWEFVGTPYEYTSPTIKAVRDTVQNVTKHHLLPPDFMISFKRGDINLFPYFEQKVSKEYLLEGLTDDMPDMDLSG